MKKWLATLLVMALALSMAACSIKEHLPIETKRPAAEPPSTSPAKIESHTPSEEDWELQTEAAVETVLDSLNSEYETLVSGINSYATYVAKQDEISAFYSKILSSSERLCIQLRVFAADYVESILTSDKSLGEMYEDMDALYDLFYDDMGDEIYDGLYDGILDDLYDDLYGDALDDRPEDVKYADWSDVRSKEYKMWSRTRSDAYEHWSDYRSDVYGFWSDLRGELWKGDLDGAKDELKDFRKDVSKLSGKAASETDTPAASTAPVSTGIRTEFKEAMDSYEKFFDEYVAFMKAYMASENPIGMMSEYAAMVQQYVDTMNKLQSVDQSQLSNEEALYYTEVMLRINQKLLEVI